jgi:hypothetical protein
MVAGSVPVGDGGGVMLAASVGEGVSGVLDGKSGVGVGSLPPLRLHAIEASSSAATIITGFFIIRMSDSPATVSYG